MSKGRYDDLHEALSKLEPRQLSRINSIMTWAFMVGFIFGAVTAFLGWFVYQAIWT